MRRFLAFALFALAGLSPALASAKHHDERRPADGLADATVMIIRHAEKPDEGAGLTPAGEARARAYVDYFKHLTLGGQAATPDTLVATADSKHSMRPRLTIKPLSQALSLPVDNRYSDDQVKLLVESLRSDTRGRYILICWHHGEIPALIEAFGGDPKTLLPKGKWPADVFGWMVVMHFDHQGRLIPGATELVQEHLMPDDTSAPANAL